jgi:hypothetical protein
MQLLVFRFFDALYLCIFAGEFSYQFRGGFECTGDFPCLACSSVNMFVSAGGGLVTFRGLDARKETAVAPKIF